MCIFAYVEFDSRWAHAHAHISQNKILDFEGCHTLYRIVFYEENEKIEYIDNIRQIYAAADEW